ncbi:hypothetical protein MIND_01114300 [Mycena indigotica]|uniref:Uncharacterized protein n=1 Tax=Mycena indigotica TaxID=2126181 RepID=A0A8H6S5A9_9AGAR|nr:uncharacterized protein MIND_01114300 [Mycena indigotica]KAF7293375.1 hypothetical protein MIND_01114300 [Mycena indigotica]
MRICKMVEARISSNDRGLAGGKKGGEDLQVGRATGVYEFLPVFIDLVLLGTRPSPTMTMPPQTVFRFLRQQLS